MQLRAARSDEAAALTTLALRSKAHWGYDAAFMDACRDELTITEAEIAAGGLICLDADQQLVGFYGLTPVSEGRVELAYLFVEPAHIGRGCGRALMAHAIEAARAAGARVLEIQGDPHAAAFYQAAGAVLVGERESDSVPGRMLPLFEVDVNCGDA